MKKKEESKKEVFKKKEVWKAEVSNKEAPKSIEKNPKKKHEEIPSFVKENISFVCFKSWNWIFIE